MNDLFATDAAQQAQPLAARLRPTSLDEYVGQQHLVGDGPVSYTHLTLPTTPYV